VVVGDIQVERKQRRRRFADKAARPYSFATMSPTKAQWETALGLAIKEFGGLDILVNNAGIEQTCPARRRRAADIQKMLAVNVTGTILGHKHAIRLMRPGGAGGRQHHQCRPRRPDRDPALGVYAKRGRADTQQSAAVECGRLGYGIRVNSIHPGLVDTDMGNKLVDDFVKLDFLPTARTQQQMLAAYPMGVLVALTISPRRAFPASEMSS
jgi:NAD(P)-dependent dehydrogenase (short-subunit alcohol dehydrogenase family)